MTRYFLPVPQVGRQPITLSPEQKRRALSQHLPVDRTDPFATDANESIRTLGKLALRREDADPNDSFALGDLCALNSLNDDRLLVLYIGKALLAYNRAGQHAHTNGDRRLSEQAVESYILWII